MKAATKDNKQIVVGVRFSEAELEQIKACALTTGHRVSTWVHWIIARELAEGARRRRAWKEIESAVIAPRRGKKVRRG